MLNGQQLWRKHLQQLEFHVLIPSFNATNVARNLKSTQDNSNTCMCTMHILLWVSAHPSHQYGQPLAPIPFTQWLISNFLQNVTCHVWDDKIHYTSSLSPTDHNKSPMNMHCLIGILCVNPRFHTLRVLRKLELTWRIPTRRRHVILSPHTCVYCPTQVRIFWVYVCVSNIFWVNGRAIKSELRQNWHGW